jgi:hypothetical protein
LHVDVFNKTELFNVERFRAVDIGDWNTGLLGAERVVASADTGLAMAAYSSASCGIPEKLTPVAPNTGVSGRL